ncbi:hypothetical protein FHETE_10635 [Fusarium heterosporum]|uniref:F-box domain-containing protein n=1 Tax=Fusarium heterosporum TaxID=42747 RepID=A0A8H5SUH9_FUSHE|nr:hypothetical protein FHETE_10635 [Fusarium heterosporum]
MYPDLPNEVLSHVFSYVLDEWQKLHYGNDFFPDLWRVRLVCRRWNDLATKHFFHTVTLWHNINTIEDQFVSWQKLMDSAPVRAAVRRVAIETAPPDDLDSCDLSAWPESWIEDGEFPEFVSAVNRIAELPSLNALEVRFNSHCQGREPLDVDFDDEITPESPAQPEPTTTRIRTLEIILEMIRKRASTPNMSVIRELELQNLQNVPLDKDLTDGLLENIERLHIGIAYEERNKFGIYLSEMFEFDPYLQKTFLPTVADQLVELTISGRRWGAIPGKFDPSSYGMSFPRLKTLCLDNYIILQPDQFDWVLELKSLTKLQLHRCTIATHCLVLQPEFTFWDVDLAGWIRVGDVIVDDGDRLGRRPLPYQPRLKELKPGWYVSRLRWDTIFDSIREKMLGLKDFCFDKGCWYMPSRDYDPAYFRDVLFNRYLAFAQAWFELGGIYYARCDHVQENMPGKPQELLELTEPTDRQALSKVLQTVKERRYRLTAEDYTASGGPTLPDM